MKQFPTAVLVFTLGASLVAGSANAQTGGKGWLERLSGPGPFDGPRYDFRVVCFFEDPGGKAPQAAWLWLDRDGGKSSEGRKSCWTDTSPRLKAYVLLESDWLSSQENNLFPAGTSASFSEVKLRSVKPALMFRVNPAVDVGVGFGFNWFSGDAFDSFFRASVQPIRLVLTPLTVFNASKARLRFLRIPVEANVFQGRFASADFGAPGNFSERGEWLWSTGIVIDVWNLVAGDR